MSLGVLTVGPLEALREILRFAQNDKGAQDDRAGLSVLAAAPSPRNLSRFPKNVKNYAKYAPKM